LCSKRSVLNLISKTKTQKVKRLNNYKCDIPPSENYRTGELLSVLSAPEFLTADGRREASNLPLK